jgi:chorismate mutase
MMELQQKIPAVLELKTVIAGPCSAETEEQVMETASALKALGISKFRAGIWKPRTQPGQFEGVGEEGLKWLRRVKQELHMEVVTEVATASHVNMALKYGVDTLWVGARTTANPFAVQELADAMRGRRVALMVKNPVNPDVALWAGAIQRFKEAGINQIAAIHRGFSSYANQHYRNPPHWQLALEFRQQFPDVPMFCDPSHMGGRRQLIAPLSQKALDLNYDGLLIETHSAPETAWSDSHQQITPDALGSIVNNLVVRQQKNNDKESQTVLECLRKQIDEVDDELIDLFARRMGIVVKIGSLKKDHKMTILQSDRWQQIMNRLSAKSHQTGLSEEFLSAVFKNIHQESINHQELVLRK